MIVEDIKAIVRAYIEKHRMIRQSETVTLGVSGGADSVCLFLLLYEMRWELGIHLYVVTIDHGIRGEESRQDADFVERLCLRRDVPCKRVEFDVPAAAKREKRSIEETARDLRYAALETAAGQGGVIAVAHHANDNAETILFNLARGTGVRGLCGMDPVSSRGNCDLIRPLLCLTREQIEEYLLERGQGWRTDASNDALVHSRNRIRLLVVPELCKVNPRAVEHINAAAEKLRSISAREQRDGEDGVEYASGSIGLDTRRMMHMSDEERQNVIMAWLRQGLDGWRDITENHIIAVTRLLDRPDGKGIDLPHGFRVRKTRSEIILERRQEGDAEEPEILPEIPISPLRMNETVELSWGIFQFRLRVLPYSPADRYKIPRNNYAKWIDYDKIRNGLVLRARKRGDVIALLPNSGHKKFKDFCIDRKIDRQERDRIPIFADGSSVIWAVGVRNGEDYRVDMNTRRVLSIQAWNVQE